MARQSIEYIMSARDELSGKLKVVEGAADKTSRSLGRNNRQLADMRSNFSRIGGQLPAVSSALGMIISPAGLAAAAVGGLAVVLSKATSAAADFNSEFRALYNLNLNKTPAQVQAMRQMVLNTAQNFGFDAQQTSGAFYDVQSVAGLQGEAARQMVSKAGMFSRVMQSDFRQTIAGTSQVMDIYRLKVKEVDKYLQSMFSTVLVGKTTFDEMSKVQVEYAQAAAAVGQNYTSANKIFAAFSKTSKSVDIAATLTKTAFEGLTRKSTIDGLKRFVKVFDNKDNIKQVDVILAELVPKLQQLNDAEFAKIKEEIGGTEGLKALLDKARSSGDAMLQSFKQFDNSGMDYGKAVRAYNEDLNELDKTVNEKLSVSLIRLGDTALPMFVSLKQAAIDLIDSLDKKLYEWLRSVYYVTDMDKYRQLGVMRIEQYTDKGKADVQGLFSEDVYKAAKSGYSDEAVKEVKDKINAYVGTKEMPGYLIPLEGNMTDDDVHNQMVGRKQMRDKLFNILESKNTDMLNELFGFEIGKKDTSTNTTTTSTLSSDSTGAKAIHSIGANSVREINITMHNDFDISAQGVAETAEQMASEVEEQFNRMLQSIEEAYG